MPKNTFTKYKIHQKSAGFGYMKKYRYTMHFDFSNSFNFFFESLKKKLINMVTILITSAKMATLGLLKIKVF